MSNVCPSNSIGHPDYLCLNYKGLIILCICIGLIYKFYSVSLQINNKQKHAFETINNSYNNTNNILQQEINNHKITLEKKNLMIEQQLLEEKQRALQQLKQNNEFNVPTKNPNGIRINIPTRGPPSEVQQVGILTKKDHTNNNDGPGTSKESIILPLMGRRPYNRSHKMVYYTIYNNVKLPLSNKGQECTSEYGCEELYNNEEITISSLNGTFIVTIYENEKLQYIPYIN